MSERASGNMQKLQRFTSSGHYAMLIDSHLHLEELHYPPIRNKQSLRGCLTLKSCKEVQ